MRAGAVTDQSVLLEKVSRAIRAVSETAVGATIRPETRLVEDLGLDSLDIVAVFMRLQDENGIEFDEDHALNFQRVSDLMSDLDQLLAGRATAA